MKESFRTIDSHPVSMRGKTPAQWSNLFPLTPWIYEDLWRVRALGILSGGPFPVEEELGLLADALAVPASSGGMILDAGCSTGLYARGVLAAHPGAMVTAVDLSSGMLKAAGRKAGAEGAGLTLVRADLAALPFHDGFFDGACMGGTLNELGKEAETALMECRRVLKQGGVFFNMHLLTAGSSAGRWLQRALAASGLRFWSREESEEMVCAAGFEVTRMEVRGVVCLSTLAAR